MTQHLFMLDAKSSKLKYDFHLDIPDFSTNKYDFSHFQTSKLTKKSQDCHGEKNIL